MTTPSADFFGERARDYEGFIERIVPGYRDANQAMLDLIPFARERNLHALDIGTGTGKLAGLLLEAFPGLSLVATDASGEMLAVSAAKLARFGARVKLREATFPAGEIGGAYDIVVSGLALHHLTDTDKQRGFRLLFAAMNPGGIVLVHDYVKGATPALEARYRALWERGVEARGHDDLSWFAAHYHEDIPATVEDQTAWLTEAGFVDVGCHWRRLSYAIFGGAKPAA